jgi:hypothetical protein
MIPNADEARTNGMLVTGELRVIDFSYMCVLVVFEALTIKDKMCVLVVDHPRSIVCVTCSIRRTKIKCLRWCETVQD